VLTRPLNNGVSLDVNTASSSPSGQLCVLPCREGNTGLAVEFLELLEHDGACGHVDAESQRFGGENDFDEFALKEFFDNLFERGQEPGVVGSDTSLEPFEPFPVTQDTEVFIEKGSAAFVHNLANFFAFRGVRQANTGLDALPHGLVTPRPAEDEENRGQKLTLSEHVDHVGPVEAGFQRRGVSATAVSLTIAVGLARLLAARVRLAHSRLRETCELRIYAMGGRLPR
jgi:hypothetical protein